MNKMSNAPENKKQNVEFQTLNAAKDLIMLGIISIFVFILSYFFDAFIFIVKFLEKYPKNIVYIDEVITVSLTLSIGFAIFAWRRWMELKKIAAERLRLQKELVEIAEVKAETERIICKQLHCDIDEYKKISRDVLSLQAKSKEHLK
jgi:NADH:ubiquinone oxidoreductase subunit 5 (subunit L)/multisubunit Na+/H+ antiporter MnhA subunit